MKTSVTSCPFSPEMLMGTSTAEDVLLTLSQTPMPLPELVCASSALQFEQLFSTGAEVVVVIVCGSGEAVGSSPSPPQEASMIDISAA
ncbi:hypothetical protein CBM2592_P290006 [Cupriavidus taiwanensis]|nr:hypothetical protein CBM2592_P290006 [Cupriavidus taiwanensis]SOZ20229.1 hypothetical protein CBM2595_P260006 [Cupriavidus taiwanensis]